MKNLTTQLRLASLLSLILLACRAAYGQLTPLGDSYTNTAAPTTNYGAKTALDVESSQTTFIQFNLSSIPASYTSADMTQATLKLYVNAVTAARSSNVDYVNGTWTESTITADNAPALGTTIAASVPLVSADKRLTETGIRFLEVVIHHRFDRYRSSARSMCSELFQPDKIRRNQSQTTRASFAITNFLSWAARPNERVAGNQRARIVTHVIRSLPPDRQNPAAERNTAGVLGNKLALRPRLDPARRNFRVFSITLSSPRNGLLRIASPPQRSHLT
jgi:hypothetical protein